MDDEDDKKNKFVNNLIEKIKDLQQKSGKDGHRVVLLKKALLSKDGIITDFSEDMAEEYMIELPHYSASDV
jgi:hypothetical protein